MRFDLNTLGQALGLNVSQALAGRLVEALATVRGSADPSPVRADELGDVLAEALSPGAGRALAEVGLSSVDIRAAGLSVTLEPAEAAAHPLLAAWLPQTLGDALAAPLVSAATLAAIAPGQATCRLIELVERGDLPARGTAVFSIVTGAGDGAVVARFGEGDDSALVTIRRLDGGGLARAGWGVLAAGAPTAVSAASPPIQAFDAAIPADVVRH